jgi:hypothetical protein
MQMTVNVPETLPKDVLQKLIAQFEDYLKEEAQNLEKESAPPSKWQKIAHEAHEESSLYGLSGFVLECSEENTKSILEIEEIMKPLSVEEKQELYRFLTQELKRAEIAAGFPEAEEFEIATIFDIESCVAKNLQEMEIPTV